MKLRHPFFLRLCGLFAAVFLRLWLSTLHLRLVPRAARGHPADPRRERFLYAFWHESVLFVATFRTKIHVLISQHADGELIAQACRHLGVGVVRGSSTRGGSPGLLQMLARSKRTHLGVTPDGPRGPRRHVQVGMIFMASQSGLPIVPLGLGFSRAWRAPSWDQLALPWPWSGVTCVVGEAITVPPDLDRQGLERFRRLVEQKMLAVTLEAERRAGVRGSVRTARTPQRASA